MRTGAGSNRWTKWPAASTPVPLYTPVPVAPLVTVAVATLTVPGTFTNTCKSRISREQE